MAWGVDEDVGDWFGVWGVGVRGCTFLEEIEHLVDFGGEEVQGCEYAAIGAEVVLLHYFFVVDRVADVDVAGKRNFPDGGVEVDYVGDVAFGVEVRVDPLHECGFARACEIQVLVVLSYV